MTVVRVDEAPFAKALEHFECAVGQDMTFPRVTNDVAYLAVCIAFVVDCPTQSEFMQNTLFVL